MCMWFAWVYLQAIFIFEAFLTLVALQSNDEENGFCVSSILGLSLCNADGSADSEATKSASRGKLLHETNHCTMG